jgi:hypothetical protein
VIVVLCVEDVLSEPGVPLSESGPTLFGRRLYTTLHNSGESLCIVSHNQNRDLVREWLLREGFSDYVRLVTRDEDPETDPARWKVAQVRSMVAAGQHIMYLVDHDPRTVPAMAETGVPVLLVVHPWGDPGRTSSAEEVPYRPWDSLVDTIETESLRRAEIRRRRRETTGDA